MRQVVQELRTGRIDVLDVPVPQPASGRILIRSRASLVSAGTERMLLDFGRASWVEKLRQQPEKARQVLDKARTDGVLATVAAVQRKLDEPLALGYSNVGEVVAVGAGVHGFAAGDRVVSNGPHAEYVSIPRNLCARVPDGVSDEAAAFTVLASIGLQAVRLAQPTLGECFVVSGLGLIGLLTVQLLRANGCRVIGVDFDASRVQLARQLGADAIKLEEGSDAAASAMELTNGTGVDGVLICTASSSDEPVRAAAQMCRKRGRIVLVGTAGLQLNRDDFYRKELSFQVSCSYGPGRYDPEYEEQGHDYPRGFVRWTEQRNFEAVLDTMAAGALRVDPLISHRFSIHQAPDAYEVLANRSSLGILFEYPKDAAPIQRVVPLERASPRAVTSGVPTIGVIGAGGYGGGVLLPAFAKAQCRLKTVVTSRGLSGTHHGRKLGFEQSATDASAMFADPEINAVVVSTRHDTHARFVLEALAAGKHVFVEKPLATSSAEIDEIESALRARASGPVLTVGFNRRFAPHVLTLRKLLSAAEGPMSAIYTVNAGAIPGEHWTQGQEGGGRIIGEACHFIDLLRFVIGHPITEIRATAATVEDIASLQMRFADGSIGSVHYFANGGKRFPKERLEVFRGGGVLQLDNFVRLQGYNWRGFKRESLWRQDKGQQQCVAAFLSSLTQGAAPPIPYSELIEVARRTLEAAEQVRTRAAL